MAIQTDCGVLVFTPHSRVSGDDESNSVPYPKTFKGIGILPTLTTEGSLESRARVKDLLGCVQTRVASCKKKCLASGSNYEGCSTCGAGKAYLKCKGKPPLRGKDFGSEYKPGPPLGRTMPPEPKKLARREKEKLRERLDAARRRAVERQRGSWATEPSTVEKAGNSKPESRGKTKSSRKPDKSGNYVRKHGASTNKGATATESDAVGADFGYDEEGFQEAETASNHSQQQQQPQQEQEASITTANENVAADADVTENADDATDDDAVTDAGTNENESVDEAAPDLGAATDEGESQEEDTTDEDVVIDVGTNANMYVDKEGAAKTNAEEKHDTDDGDADDAGDEAENDEGDEAITGTADTVTDGLSEDADDIGNSSRHDLATNENNENAFNGVEGSAREEEIGDANEESVEAFGRSHHAAVGKVDGNADTEAVGGAGGKMNGEADEDVEIARDDRESHEISVAVKAIVEDKKSSGSTSASYGSNGEANEN